MLNSGRQVDEIQAGHTATIENTGAKPVAIGIEIADSRLEMELAAGQMVEVATGESGGRVSLRKGDPSALLVIRPDTP